MTLRLEALGQRSETVRRSNLSAIVRELHDGGPASRSELVARTGLTRSAIRALIGELAAADLVVEERAEPQGTPGRPSPVVRIDPNGAVVLALEIAVDSLAAAIVGLGGEVFERVRIDRAAGHTGVDGIAADLADMASGLRARRPADETPVGVGVAIVGVVRRSDGVVSLAPNLGWRDAPLGDALAAALGLEAPISVANDADLGALVEFRRGAAIGGGDVLFISGEYGVGGGLIVDGRPLTGVAGYGGEVGHMPVNPTGSTCRCGAIGCWETEVGEAALGDMPTRSSAYLKEPDVRGIDQRRPGRGEGVRLVVGHPGGVGCPALAGRHAAGVAVDHRPAAVRAAPAAARPFLAGGRRRDHPGAVAVLQRAAGGELQFRRVLALPR